LITAQHAPLGFLGMKDLVRINLTRRSTRPNQRASSETPLHLAIYKGTEAQAVVHAHPPAVLAFSSTHASFLPISFEEKYSLGEVPIIPQDTPTVTRPDKVVEELQLHPIVILKEHGTVAIGKNLREAFLLTDLLQEAIHCQFLKQRADSACFETSQGRDRSADEAASFGKENCYPLFSHEHMTALVNSANNDLEFRSHGTETGLTTSLTLRLEETDISWTVKFVEGRIAELDQRTNGEFRISGKKQSWEAVFQNRIDPFFATQQGKLKLERGELVKLAQWYKPFQRAFSLWQSIPIR
jgi:L-fuculose-phosphate aldolase